jgi:hypothetical protein
MAVKTFEEMELERAAPEPATLEEIRAPVEEDLTPDQPMPIEEQVEQEFTLAADTGMSLDDARLAVQYGIGDKGKPIGFWEAAKQDIFTKIPFSTAGIFDLLGVWTSSKRLQKNEYAERGFANLQKYDIKIVESYLEKMAERERRGYTGFGKFGAMASAVPAWMIEFALTGGLKKIGSTAAKSYLKDKVQSKIATGLASWAAGAAVRTTLGMPHRVVESALRRRLMSDSENWATSISLGWGDVFIEALSEEAGGVIMKGAGAVTGGLVSKLPFGKKFLGALQASWMSLSPDNTAANFIKKLFAKGGYNGIVGEIGEERLATLLHGLVGTEDFGAGKEAGPLARILAGFKQDWENKYIELGVFGTIGGGQIAAQTVAAKVAGPAAVEAEKPGVTPPETAPIAPEEAAVPAEKPAPPAAAPVEAPARELPTEAKPIVEDLTKSLFQAKKELPKFKKEKRKALGQRVAMYQKYVTQAIEKEGISPLQAHRRARGALKGILADRPSFTPPKLAEEQWLTLEHDIQDNPYEKYPLWQDNALEALEFVRQGIVPPRFQIAMLEQQFGREFGEALTKLLPFDAWDVASQLIGLPRSTLSSGDVSGILRQGRLLVNAYPAEGAEMAAVSLRAFASEATSIELDKKLRQHENYALWKDAHLELTSFARQAPEYEREEAFPVGGIAEKVPLVRRSERAFVVGLNTLRFGVAERLRTIWEASYGKSITPKAAKQIAGWVNAASGRAGRTQISALRQISMFLNKVMFSPRFAISRLTAPARLFSSNPIVLRSAWRSFASMEGTNIMLLGLAALAGATVSLDPRSADFKKIKAGTLRLDLNAGFQQPFRFIYQMMTGERVTAAGKEAPAGRVQTISRFARSKTAPWSGLIWDILEGRNWVGEPLGMPPADMGEKLSRGIPLMPETWAKGVENFLGKHPIITGVSKEVYNRMAYLALQGITDAALEEGWPTGLLALSEIVGVSSQAYPERARATLQKRQDELAQQAFGETWENLTGEQQEALEPEFEDLAARVRQDGIRNQWYIDKYSDEQVEVHDRFNKALSESIHTELWNIGAHVGSISRQAIVDRLSDQRFERYEELVIPYLRDGLEALFQDPEYEAASISEKYEMAKKVIDSAKREARVILKAEIEGEEI